AQWLQEATHYPGLGHQYSGSQSTAQATQADAEDDEKDEGWRHGQHDAWYGRYGGHEAAGWGLPRFLIIPCANLWAGTGCTPKSLLCQIKSFHRTVFCLRIPAFFLGGSCALKNRTGNNEIQARGYAVAQTSTAGRSSA